MAPDWEDSAQPLQNMLRNREPVFRSESWVCPIKLWNTVHSVNFVSNSVRGDTDLVMKFTLWSNVHAFVAAGAGKRERGRSARELSDEDGQGPERTHGDGR